MISQRARYAFKALTLLARIPVGESLQIRDMAAREGIPRSFLEQIMLELRRAQLVGSRRGKEGGYHLLRAPAEITFAEILRLVDGPLAPVPCLSRSAYKACADCPDEASCAVRAGLAEIFQAHLAALERISLAGAVERGDKAGERRPGYGANPYSGAFI